MKCKNCGADLELTIKPFIHNAYIPVLNVERYECPKCGSREFTPEQLEALEECFEDYEHKRAMRLLERPVPQVEERDFGELSSQEEIDKMLEWIGGTTRVAHAGEEDARVACMSVETYRTLADVAFPALPLELWELDGFCVEDMPTVQHVFRALDTDAFIDLLVAERAGEDDDGLLRERLMTQLLDVRTKEMLSCDKHPIVMLPRRRYVSGEDDGWASGFTSVCGYQFSTDAEEMARSGKPVEGTPPEELLGWKAWLALPGVRDTYELMAELFALLIGEDHEEARRTGKTDNPYTQDLNRTADGDFRKYLAGFLQRVVPREDLVTISVEVDADLLEKATVIMEACGLTMQNALNIAINRFISAYDGRHDSEHPSLSNRECRS